MENNIKLALDNLPFNILNKIALFLQPHQILNMFLMSNATNFQNLRKNGWFW